MEHGFSAVVSGARAEALLFAVFGESGFAGRGRWRCGVARPSTDGCGETSSQRHGAVAGSGFESGRRRGRAVALTALRATACLCFAAFLAASQGPPPGGTEDRRPPPRGRPYDDRRQYSGKWWTNRAVVQRLGLSDAQQKHIDQIFQQSRLRLIDLQAALDKQELMLDPLLAEDHPQESLVLPQIDRVASARAELEKANARMLFEIRLVLTPEQWKELQSGDSRFDNVPPPRMSR
jgi:Spy/CpxP family protein refolding chaperone